MILNLVLLFAGFITLIKGADFMVSGASSLAKRLNVSSLVIGLTVVAFGTSAPELTVNILNSMNGRNEAIFGNVIGSNIFNLLFILGFTGMIYPLVVQKNSVKYEVPLSLLAILVLWLLVNDDILTGSGLTVLSRADAVGLMFGFLFFMWYIYRSMKSGNQAEEEQIREYSIPMSSVLVVAGIGMLVGGGYLVTENAVAIAMQFGLSEKLIGLTILAVGTSLPELATCVVAAYKRSTDIAIGNVIGSNIFNIFFIMGINGLIKPVRYVAVLNEDIYVLIAGTLILLISMFTFGRNKLDRWEAMLLFIGYIAYTVYLVYRN
ncbi:MAG: calcium/sodium antiporter [Bacteroidia bacterium]|nr:calcium/sodium antiporter [Bacteroidia bacterium]